MRRKLFIILFYLIIIAVKPIYGDKIIDVFAIQSNVIKSWIQYSVKLDDNFKFFGNEPAFGFRKRPSGSSRELSYFEKRYYDIESQKVLSDTTIEVKFKALPSKKIIIEIADKKVISYIDINKSKCILQKVMINATEGLFSSYTGYVEITGIDIKSGNIIHERINKD